MSMQEAVAKLQNGYGLLSYVLCRHDFNGFSWRHLVGLRFFGADHLLFGTDSPFDGAGGNIFNQETIFTVKALPITPEERSKIFRAICKRF